MIDLNKAQVTGIQFFDLCYKHGEEDILAYSANIIIDECLIVQVSGNDDECHGASIPTSNEQYWQNEELQDWACDNLDLDDVEKFLNRVGIENNFYFLSEY